jgi:hypothetical protein
LICLRTLNILNQGDPSGPARGQDKPWRANLSALNLLGRRQGRMDGGAAAAPSLAANIRTPAAPAPKRPRTERIAATAEFRVGSAGAVE